MDYSDIKKFDEVYIKHEHDKNYTEVLCIGTDDYGGIGFVTERDDSSYYLYSQSSKDSANIQLKDGYHHIDYTYQIRKSIISIDDFVNQFNGTIKDMYVMKDFEEWDKAYEERYIR